MPLDRRRIEKELERISRPEERRAWIGILETHDRVVRGLDLELRRSHALTYRDIEALARLGEAPGGELSISDLAERILLSPSRVSRLVAELERAGLVDRKANPADGRSTTASITREGRDRLLEAGPTYLNTLNRLLFDHLTRKDVDELNRIWSRLPGNG